MLIFLLVCQEEERNLTQSKRKLKLKGAAAPAVRNQTRSKEQQFASSAAVQQFRYPSHFPQRFQKQK